MTPLELIQKTIDYIDEHVQEKIAVEDLAALSGFSTYHFYRVFSSYVGLTVMHYVTRRKLQFALYELQSGQKIIDVAMNYGFETHAGFTKAFKKCFGYPPHLYRIHAPIHIPQKIDLSKIIAIKTGGIIMQPKLVERNAFKIVGFEFEHNLKDTLHTRDIPAFWSQRGLTDGACETKLYATLTPPKHGEYCFCVKKNMETDDFSYVLGVGVDTFDLATSDMYTLEVPTTTYAVFSSPEVIDDEFVSSIQGTWQYILEDWFPTSGYVFDETNLDFEYYDERCHPWEYEKLSMEIWIPVKKK